MPVPEPPEVVRINSVPYVPVVLETVSVLCVPLLTVISLAMFTAGS